MTESTQHKLDRVRPPRVQITYDVEIGNAIVMKELPYVVGIIADLSGHPEQPLPKMKMRKFVEVDRDNFNDLMASIAPRLTLRVTNKLNPKETLPMSVVLTFKNLDDFSPVQVLKQISPLNDLYTARQKLSDLVTKLDGNDPLAEMLLEMLQKPDVLKEVQGLLQPAPPPGASPAAPPPEGK